jgi:hypothetical protein
MTSVLGVPMLREGVPIGAAPDAASGRPLFAPRCSPPKTRRAQLKGAATVGLRAAAAVGAGHWCGDDGGSDQHTTPEWRGLGDLSPRGHQKNFQRSAKIDRSGCRVLLNLTMGNKISGKTHVLTPWSARLCHAGAPGRVLKPR